MKRYQLNINLVETNHNGGDRITVASISFDFENKFDGMEAHRIARESAPLELSMLEIILNGGTLTLPNAYSFTGEPHTGYIQLKDPLGQSDGVVDLSLRGLKEAFGYAKKWSEENE